LPALPHDRDKQTKKKRGVGIPFNNPEDNITITIHKHKTPTPNPHIISPHLISPYLTLHIHILPFTQLNLQACQDMATKLVLHPSASSYIPDTLHDSLKWKLSHPRTTRTTLANDNVAAFAPVTPVGSARPVALPRMATVTVSIAS
jgi:hypothetical protein